MIKIIPHRMASGDPNVLLLALEMTPKAEEALRLGMVGCYAFHFLVQSLTGSPLQVLLQQPFIPSERPLLLLDDCQKEFQRAKEMLLQQMPFDACAPIYLVDVHFAHFALRDEMSLIGTTGTAQGTLPF